MSGAQSSIRRHVLDRLYGISVVALALPCGLACWACLKVMGSPYRRWRFAHHAIRTFACGVGIRIVVEGELAWPRHNSVVVVANHSSFLDAISFVGSFPQPIRPVAASEFARRPFVGSVLKRIGTEFVHRGDPQQVSRDTRHLLQMLRNGDRLLICKR